MNTKRSTSVILRGVLFILLLICSFPFYFSFIFLQSSVARSRVAL